MRRIYMTKIAALTCILVGYIVQGCSVKEDRSACPCWLQIDLSGCHHYTDNVQLKGWTSERNVLGARVFEDDFDQLYEAEVPRGVVTYCAYSGIEASTLSGMRISIPRGSQSDRLFAYRNDVITEGESAYDKVRLHKQYANVTLKFKDDEGMTVTPQGITVSGNWDGMDLRTLSPCKGEFRISPSPNEDGTWIFRLPRQGDDSLSLEVKYEDGMPELIDLGKVIAETGYDWNAEDLDDIWIGVDRAQCEVTVIIKGWEEGFMKDIII